MARPKDALLRDRLVEAATEAFAEHGFAGATMTGVGQAAGVTKGGVYFHFHSKEDLFFAVLDYWRERLRTQTDDLEPAGSGVADLRAFLRSFLEFHFSHPGAASLPRVLATELAGRFTAQMREDTRSFQRSLRARIRALLSSGIQDGSLFADDPASSAFVTAGTVEGIVYQWVTSPRDAEPFCHAESLAEVLVASYATGSSGGRCAPVEDEGEDPDFRPPF